MLVPTNKMVKFDHENSEIEISNSPIKLIDGGRARLVRLPKNQNRAMRGKAVCRPRAIIIVRLWIRS